MPLSLFILSKDIPLWCHKGTPKRHQNTLTKQLFSLYPHPSERHFWRAPPPDVCRVAKRGCPIKGWKPPFDGAHKDGKPGRSWQLVGLAVDWLVWRADKWGDIWGGWRGRRTARAARLKRHFRGSQRERDVVATAVCWGTEREKKKKKKSAFERLIRTEEAQTCSGRRPVSTSNGGAAENRQTGLGWLCYKWAINSNWICSRKHINQTKAFIHIGILKGKAISRHGGSCHGEVLGGGAGVPIVLFFFSFLFTFVILTFAARRSLLQVTRVNQ